MAVLLLLAGWWLAAAPAWSAPPRDSRLAGQVLSLLRREFPHPDRLEPRRLLRGALQEAAAAVPSLIYRMDPSDPVLKLRVGGRRAEFDLAGLRELALLERMLDALSVFAGLPPEGGASYAVLFSRGMLHALDSHSTLLAPENQGDAGHEAGERGDGVGLAVARRGGLLTITAVTPGSPAAKAGLHPGQRVLQIGSHSTLSLSRERAESLLRGAAGSPVALMTWKGAGAAPTWVRLRRTRIGAGNVVGRLMGGRGDSPVAYLRIGGFTPTTAENVRGLLERYIQRGTALAGIVLDLRGNPGGGLEEGIHLADLFLDRGVIVTLKGKATRAGTVRARWYRTVSALPMVVLVDGGTASAAEMVAGALKANQRAWVMGTPTFGKTAVQSIFPLDGGYVAKLTVANFSTRPGAAPGQEGIIPHVVLAPVWIDGETLGTRGLHPPSAWGDGRPLPLLVLSHLASGGPGQSLPGDYALDLSLKVLRFNQPANPHALFQTAPLFLQEERQRQQRGITERLRRQGIDWNPGNGGAAGQLTLKRVEAFVRDAAGDAWRPLRNGLRAGQELRLNLALRNPGGQALHRVLGVIEKSGGFLEGLQIPVGRILAGQSRQAAMRVRLPGRLPQGRERFQVRLVGPRGRVLARSQYTLPLDEEGWRPPALWVSLFEDGRAGSVGNGDGRLQAGETVSLRVRSQRPAAGALRRLLLWVGGLDQLQGSMSHAWGAIPMRDGAANPRVQMHLSLPAKRGRLSPRLSLNLIGELEGGGTSGWSFPLSLSPLPRDMPLQPPRIQLAGKPRRHGSSLRLRGEVLAGNQGGVARLLVYLNGKKVEYLRASRSGARRLPFVIDTRLEAGRNRLDLVAMDGNGMTGRRELVLWPAGEEPISLALPQQ